MTALDARPEALDVKFRPGSTVTLNLAFPTDWLDTASYTATLNGTSLNVTENGDTLVIAASGAVTGPLNSEGSRYTFILHRTGGNDALVGTWTPSNNASPSTTVNATVLVEDLDVAVTILGSGTGGGGGVVDTIVAGTGIDVDSTDPQNPIVSATGGGGAVDSVNGQTGVVVLGASDVGADAAGAAAAAVAAIPSNAAAGTPSLRSLGTTATTAAAGNDSRLSDSRTPAGGAGGVLSGTYPNPGFAVDMATQAELDAEASARSAADGLLVPKTTTVNGHALSANVTVSASDVGLGNVTNDAQLKAADLDNDTTLAADSATKVPSQHAVKTYVNTAVTGLLDFKGSTDASTNPNYPAASKGDTYVVSVAGKVGGASGKSVDVGDMYLATADNAGGTEASVGTSWTVLEHNLVGALLAANNLSDLTNAGTARTNLGLAIGTDVEAHDADLTTIAGLSPSNDDFMQRKGGAWTNRTIAQVKTDLNLSGTNTGDQDLSGLVPKTTTVNGHALSGNVSVTGADVGIPSGAATGDIQVWDDVAGEWVAVTPDAVAGADITTDPSGWTEISGTDVQAAFDATDAAIAGLAGAGVADGDKGDITVSSSGTVWTIDNDVVTYAKMQNVSATSRFLGRKTTGAGDPEEISPSEAKTILAIANTDVSGLGTASTVNTGTTSGTVPVLGTGGVLAIGRLATGTPDGTKFVRDDGTLATPAGGSSTIGPTQVVSKTSTYTAAAGDVVLADASGGAFTVTLPAVSSGRWVTVKKISTGGNTVTVSPASGTIDGAATYAISIPYTSRDFVSDGTNWFVL